MNEDGTGFTEVLVVATPEAAADPALSEVEFPVAVSEGLAITDTGDGFTVTDDVGEVAFSSPPAVMWDSAGGAAGSTHGADTS